MVIPKNLDECFTELRVMLGKLVINELKNEKESELCVFHHGLSTSVKNNWNLWQADSPLSQYFNQLGIDHADDMSDIILTAFWRHLNNKPINLKELVKYYREFWLNFEEGDNNMLSI